MSLAPENEPPLGVARPAEHLLALIEPILVAESVEAAATAAACQLGAGTGATATGLFLVMHGTVFIEAWHPRAALESDPIRAHFHRLAIDSAQRVEAGGDAAASSVGGLVPRVHVFGLPQRLTGVLCLGFGAGAGADGGPWVEQVVRLVARRIVALLEIEAERRKSGQYERWFKVSDRQIRSLELERQKFAALASIVDQDVFVADAAGTVRWSGRSAVERVPPENGGSWVGYPCEAVCRRMGAGQPVCQGCLVRRVVATGATVVQASCGASGAAVSAVPIKGLDGEVCEVMVAVRHGAPAARAEAA